jgi:hypothetical protein
MGKDLMSKEDVLFYFFFIINIIAITAVSHKNNGGNYDI